MNRRYFLNLPSLSLNILSTAFGVSLICLGIRIARASDVALEVANTKLVTSSSAKKLERLAQQLEVQAEVIEQKDKAYQDLEKTYRRTVKGTRGQKVLTEKIKKVETLPDVENLSEIKSEIEATEQMLIESANE